MKIRQIAVALVTLVCFGIGGRMQAQPQILPVLVGFNQPNSLGVPCVACLGFPAGTVVIQPNSFVSSNSTGLYYAIFQANGWSGDLSTSFTLTGAGGVIQNLTLAGTSVDGQDVTVLSGQATIPETSYSGPATLEGVTTATPGDGSPAFTLTSSAVMQIGTTGTHRLVQLAGISSSNGIFGLPCVYPICGPPGAVVFQPDSFYTFSNPGVYYVAFQSNGWTGDVDSSLVVIQNGKVVGSGTVGGAVAGSQRYAVVLYGTGGLSYRPTVANAPATLAVITDAYSHIGSGQDFTLRSVAPIQIAE